MNNIKAIFLDNETTLENIKEQKNIGLKNIIRKLKDLGIHVVITSNLKTFLTKDICLNYNASKYK